MSAKLDKWIVPLFYVLTLLGLPAEARVLLVWRDNPNLSAPPYDGGWETAATNIQDALDVALDGDTVLVTNGVYDAGGRVAPGDTTLKTRVIVTNAVTVRSVNGPEATLIVGQPHTTGGLGDTAVRGVYLNNGGVLSGFTVTNGFTRSGTSTTASYVGGGVRCEGVAAAVSNCVIVANQAAMRGGGVFQGTLTDCRVITNIVVSSSTSAGGGGVYGAAVSVSLIENNRTLGSSTDGGGTHSCTLERSTLRGNASARHGGGAYLSTLVSCTVESNSAVQQGGGAHSPVVVTNSLIRWNTAGYYGGGLYKGAVTDSVIASNTVTGLSYDGGGYYGNSAADDRLTGCDVVGNVARNGGGVYNAVLSNCTVRANRAVGSSATTGSGGGYYASATGYQVYNTRFLDNEANYRGGGAYQGKFFGCVFSGNRAAQGGGFYSGSTSYVLYNCSVMGNCATNQYGGTYSGTVSNSIVYANTAVTGPNYGGGTFRHSCADPLPAGAGNTNVNPLVSGWRDPHLLPGSPLIAAGAFGPWMDGAADLDGDARASDGVVDIGADQFSGSTLDGPLAVALASDTNVCAVAWPHLFRAEAEGKVSGIYWDFGDGFTAQGLNPATHAFAVPGVYAVKVTVSNETHAAFATFEITVIDYVVYSSPEGGHVPPFVSWADAATNLQDAVDAVALPGGRVLAGDGVYDAGARVAAGQTVTNRLVLDKAVRVESVNGPAATVIAGRWHSEETPLGALAIRGVYVANGAVLCGFTVSNGATAAVSYSDNGRGGGLFLAAGGAATNCTVTGCRAWVGGGAAGAAGVLRGCVLSGNAALTASGTSGYGGGMHGLLAEGCAIVSNTAYIGGGAYECTLTGCDILSNIADNQGGGAYYGVLDRCRVLGNRSGAASYGVGGGVYDAVLTSCLISGNTSRQGGGVYGSTVAKGMYNCTVVANTATVTGTTQGGGGFYGNGTSYPVRNCIVYHNASGGLGTNLYQGAVTYTCSLPLPAGEGNMDAAPMIADFSNGRLLPGSPCAGAGLYEEWMAQALDVEGEPRAGTGSVDMGADQLFVENLTGPLSVAIEGPAWPYFPGAPYTFTATITGKPTNVNWDFGDNTATSGLPQVTHVWSEGDYVVRLTVSNATHTAEATLALNVAPDTRYVSSAGSHTPPFRSWADAATNLQDAADTVMASGRVLVAAGVYDTGGRAFGSESLTNRLMVTNGVTVIAVDGPDVTFIVGAASGAPVTNGLGDGAVRGVRLAAGASLRGFTVRDGRTRWSTSLSLADYFAGGVYCADDTAVISNCVIRDCQSATRAGGVHRGRIFDTSVLSNRVLSGWAGGINLATVISNCIVRGNEASQSAGGIYQGYVMDSVLDGNQAGPAGSGGGYYGGATNHVLRGCTIINNRCGEYGGGVYYAGVHDSLFTNNAAKYGGAYAMAAFTTPVPPVYRCRLFGNRGTNVGGGTYFGALYSCVLSGNVAGGAGGGAYYAALESCTVVDNEAASGGGCSQGKAYSSIIYHNRAASGPEYDATESWSCCTTPKEAWVTWVPVLEPPRLTGFRDPHLLPGSPCLNAGQSRPWHAGTEGLDMDREARVAGASVDIGADERHETALEGPLQIQVIADHTTFGVSYAPQFRAETEGKAGEMFWDFGDGQIAQNVNPVSHAFAACGVYQVVVTVTNATHSASATQTVEVVAGDSFVSLSGGHVPPFASWSDAATNIQDAVDAAVFGGTVWVADGTYEQGGRPASGQTHLNRVCIEKPVTVRGANGPASAVIRGAWHDPGVTPWGAGAVRGVFLGHAGARLIGVTVADAAAGAASADASGGGVYCAAPGAGGSNCVVSGCGAYYDGGGVCGGLWQASVFTGNVADLNGGGAADAVLEACTLTGNTAASDGGGAEESVLSDCTVTGNEAQGSDGGGVYYCTATRCLILGNRAYDDGGGSSDGYLVNCLVAGNESGYGGGAAYGTLDVCTVVSNAASHYGGGVYDTDYVLNTVIWDNQAPSDPQWSYGYYANCLTAPLPDGAYDGGGNLTGDPLFVNAAAGDYRLAAASPCINAGALDGYAQDDDAVDLDARPRVLGSAPDIGAYEYGVSTGFAALGTPIDWLDDYYDGPDWDAAELDDSDDDGLLAWEEYIAGTSPVDGASVFAIVAVARVAGYTELTLNTVSGRIYTVERRSLLSSLGQWENADAPFAGNGQPVTVSIPDAEDAAYYRVRVSLP